jgi:hypothetical protein
MARYVVLEFDDNDAAGAFLEVVKDPYLMDGFPDGVKVKAVFAKPTKFCDCPLPGNIAKGAALGWFICSKCAKARRGWQYPDNLLQEKRASRVDFVRAQMLRAGFIEGFDKNPEEDWGTGVRLFSSSTFQGKR